MTTIVIKKQKMHELKEMINEGLHIFGRAMSVAEQMCEEGEMGERYGERSRMGMREDSEMGMRGYPSYPMDDSSMYGDRRNSRGRYSRY